MVPATASRRSVDRGVFSAVGPVDLDRVLAGAHPRLADEQLGHDRLGGGGPAWAFSQATL